VKGIQYSLPHGEMDQIHHLFDEIRLKFKRLDILVNNAATNPFFGDVLSADEKAWDKTFTVNMKGVFFISQQAAKMMKETARSHRQCGLGKRDPASAFSEYLLDHEGRDRRHDQSFAKELASLNIRVNALLPGLTDTKFSSMMINNPR